MKVGADGRTWTTALEIAFGKHQYKFVRDDAEWIVDPKAKSEDDGGGNINSLLTVLPDGFDGVASPADGKTTMSAIYFDQTPKYLNVIGNKVELTVRTRKNDVSAVRFNVAAQTIAARKKYSDELYDYFSATSNLPKGDLSYKIGLKDGANSEEISVSVLKQNIKPFEVPTWVQDSVIYQIFPDRFENGSKANDPKELTPWEGKPEYFNRFGGDFAGVQKRASYLKNLGVDTIYFNPIFKSPSNHRYDADSYLVVDPQLGTNQEYIALTKNLKKQGIGVVLDFAFNHTSVNADQFLDLRKKGANSKFKDWYFPKSFPIQVKENPNYEAWYGFSSMPKLNVLNPETKEHLLNVAKFWITQSELSGMRLDVANEVDSRFWREMRPFVKGLKRDLWICGEIWTDGNQWLQGDQFDSVMNYQFRDPMLKFVAKGTMNADAFRERMMSVYYSYPSQVSKNMMNLLSSHDVPRFITECGGDAELAKIGAAVQFTWAGAPNIYYGEELGMEGGKDPDNRRGMSWSKANNSNSMLSYYKTLIATRKRVSSLRNGEPEFVFSSNDAQSVAFTRSNNRDAAITAINRSDREQTISFIVPKSVQAHSRKGLIDIFSGSRYAVSDRPIKIVLKPKSAQVLIPASISNSSPAPLASNYAKANGDSAQRRANPTQEPQH